MTILFFVGQGSTSKSIQNQYVNNKYIKDNFIEQLKKIDKVIIPEINYNNVYYYQKTNIKGYKQMFNPIQSLSLDDIYLDKYIKKLFNEIKNNKSFIIMAHSDGIYFAMEFARLYPKYVKQVISLDGSWITTNLCKQRIENWIKNGKKFKLIKTQKELDNIIYKIKNETNNDIYIKQLLDHTRYEHTLKCIKYNYEKIKVKYTVFRDFNSDTSDINFNKNALVEHEILLKKNKNYNYFWLIDASHNIWFNKFYKKQILDYVSKN